MLLCAVVLMASRVGDPARFVSWPVVAFTALASAVALVGLWAGLPRPSRLAAGVLPALVLSYVLPAAPLLLVTAVLIVLGCAAVAVRGVVAGVAATTAVLITALVVLQGPAVSCGTTSVSSNTGPWWIASADSSSASGSSAGNGRAQGTTQVGSRHYAYRCADGRLVSFDRVVSRSP